jgi:hypothetical protein
MKTIYPCLVPGFQNRKQHTITDLRGFEFFEVLALKKELFLSS